jgi:hypothetical protein
VAATGEEPPLQLEHIYPSEWTLVCVATPLCMRDGIAGAPPDMRDACTVSFAHNLYNFAYFNEGKLVRYHELAPLRWPGAALTSSKPCYSRAENPSVQVLRDGSFQVRGNP